MCGNPINIMLCKSLIIKQQRGFINIVLLHASLTRKAIDLH